MESKGLWITPEIMGDQRLNNTEKMLLAEIQNLTQLGECFAGNEHFAQLLGLSKTRVTHLLTNLNRLKLIAIELTYKEGSKEIDKRTITPMVKNDYTPSQKQPYPMVENDYTPMVKNDQDKKQVFKKQIKKQHNKDLYISEFAELWALYPNKKGRPQAEQAYIRARKENVEYETIKNGLESYIKYVKTQHTEKRFIKHGSTWFNQKAWADEYELHGQRPKGIFGLVYDEYNQGEDYFEQDRGNKGFGSFEELLPEPIEIIGRGQYSQYDSANVGK
jgi:hypothetical protein